ncbi:MAG TPA: hypothetical protein V6C96_02030 [Vampirovibrionales bacterium]
MIPRLIQNVLQQDTSDDNESAFKAALQLKYPNITNTDYFQYWKSLNTLLGGVTDQKIVTTEENLLELQPTYEDSKLPVILITQSRGFSPSDKSLFSYEGEICLSIHTPAADGNSLDAFHVYKRVKKILFPEIDGVVIDEACFNFPNYGVNQLLLKLDRLDKFYNRSVKMYLKARYTEI